jgi:hypothetical protein
MKPSRPSLHRVRSQPRLDTLEDRLLLSVLAGCSAMIDASSVASAQSTTDSSSASSACPDAATTTSTDTTANCPQSGATDTSLGSGVTSGFAANGSSGIATITVQAPSTNPVTPSSVYPVGLTQAYTLNLAFLGGGETPAAEAEARAPAPADAALSYTAASELSFSASEHDLSWVDDSASEGHESATPRALFAPANEADAKRAAPVIASQLVADFQPLEDASPFLLATLKAVAVQTPEASSPVSAPTLVASTIEQVPDEHAGSWQSPAVLHEETPPADGTFESAPSGLIKTTGGSTATNQDLDEGYLFAGSWRWVGQAALPVAGFLGALGIWQSQRKPDPRVAGREPWRKPVLLE